MSPGLLVKSLINRVAPSRFLLHRYSAPGHTLALTFDDGPHPVHTPLLIDVLGKAGVTATFFVQGSEARKYPSLVQDLVAAGHQIGNHGNRHLDCKRVGFGEYIADIEDAQQLLQDTTGTDLPKLFRPPYGSVTPKTFLALNTRGYKYVFWSADSRDSFIREPDKLLQHVKSLPIRSGDVLLFHEDYPHSVNLIGELVNHFQNQEYAFVPVSHYL